MSTSRSPTASVHVKGPKGQLEVSLLPGYQRSVDDGTLTIDRADEEAQTRAFHGLVRSLLANAVTGVSEGWSKELEIVGIGYRAEKQGNEVVFNLGYSHPINFAIPDGIEIEVDGKANSGHGDGIDRQQVGQIAAEIRASAAARALQGQGHPLFRRADSHQGREAGSDSMSRIKDRKQRRDKIKRRFRAAVRGTADRPRLAVYRSLRHVYAQVIDDEQGRHPRRGLDPGKDSRRAISRRPATAKPARCVGKLIAERAKEQGVETVVFDRGGFQYHGVIRPSPNGAREAGLKF